MYADLWCANLGGESPAPTPCSSDTGGSEEGDTGPGNSEWNPAEHVAHDPRTDVYEIDAIFIADLKAESFASLSRDRARTIATLSGYSQLVNVADGDLVALLGLESGDMLVNLNGHELDNTDAQIEAYGALKDSTWFVLTVNRGGTMQRLSYTLVD